MSSKNGKKANSLLGKARVSRRDIALTTFAELAMEDREFWARQTPQARLRAMELMRRINYGQAAAGRLQRLLEVVQPEKS